MRRVTVLTLLAALSVTVTARAGQQQRSLQPIRPSPVPPVTESPGIHLKQPRLPTGNRPPRVAVSDEEQPAVAAPAKTARADTGTAVPAAKAPASTTQTTAPQPVPDAGPAPTVRRPAAPVRRAAPARAGFFDRLMQLERRKNAWLRRTFFR